jgi:hypothetical protein
MSKKTALPIDTTALPWRAFARKSRRSTLRLIHKANGGFVFTTPDPLPFDLDHGYNSTRPERRRKKLGRA